MSDNLSLLEAIHALKHLPRKGWVEHGLDAGKVESVGSHAFGTAALAVILKETGYLPKNVPLERVLVLALFHDIVESLTGDITPASKVTPEKKASLELDAARKLLGGIPGMAAVQHDLEAFIATPGKGSTDPVHSIVKQLDKLDMMIQSLFYEQSTGKPLSDFNNDPGKYLVDKKLLAFFDSILKRICLE
nr:HD domain-containing protein [Candidatus Sigynarchaeota archaeon]